jgi:hypothetical protein
MLLQDIPHVERRTGCSSRAAGASGVEACRPVAAERGTGPLSGGQRVWRLRKLHQAIDATIRAEAADAVELRFLLNGEVIYARRWATRAQALAAADQKRGELEREGWMPHW